MNRLLLIFLGLAVVLLLVNQSAYAHATRDDCVKLLDKLPNYTKLDTVHKHSCTVEWDTINGYESRLYVQKFGCTYSGGHKYLVRDLPGNDKYGNPYIYSTEGFKYKRYYSCPVESTGHNKE